MTRPEVPFPIFFLLFYYKRVDELLPRDIYINIILFMEGPDIYYLPTAGANP